MKTYKLPKTLTLDYNTWRCGRDSYYKLGQGYTKLLNGQGYMCCLGQFCIQSGVSPRDIKERGNPSHISISGLCCKRKEYHDITALSCACININDAINTTIAEKVKQLKRVLGKSKYKLNLVNFPQSVLDELRKMGCKV